MFPVVVIWGSTRKCMCASCAGGAACIKSIHCILFHCLWKKKTGLNPYLTSHVASTKSQCFYFSCKSKSSLLLKILTPRTELYLWHHPVCMQAFPIMYWLCRDESCNSPPTKPTNMHILDQANNKSRQHKDFGKKKNLVSFHTLDSWSVRFCKVWV